MMFLKLCWLHGLGMLLLMPWASLSLHAAPAALQETTEATAQDPQLRFSFDQQPWQDVLNWFARQADLSLVVDQLPPGEFTYSDTRTYSPTESIDLLNSVLMTKNFTLVRKDKMLIVLNTQNGVPYDLIPKIDVTELAARGRFELVTVAFPLEGRPLDTVKNEIEPLIGTLGRVYPMPATGQMQVTETAGKMSAIQALIQSIPKPQPPKKPEPKPQPPAQVLKPYAVRDLDLQPTADLLTKAVGGIRATVDEKTNQIFIYATEAQHVAIDSVLETLRANPQEDRVEVQSYDYRTADPTQLTAQLVAISPNAVVQADPALKRLVVVAPMTDQALIKQAIEKIEGPATVTLQLKAFDVDRDDQTQIVATVEEMVPGIKITAQPELDKLLVIGNAEQQTQVTQLLTQFQEQGLLEQPSGKQLETFALKHLDPTEANTLLSTIETKVELQVDAQNRRLLGYLTSAEAERVRAALAQLDVAPDAAFEPQLKIYPVTATQYEKMQPLLPQLAPNVEVNWDAAGKRLVAIADQEGHDDLARLLESIQPLVEDDSRRVMRVYEVTAEQKSRLSTVLPTLADRLPDVQVISESDPRRLTVWAPDAQQQELVAVLQELVPQESMAGEPVMRAYAVTAEQKTRFTAVLPTLQERLPDVQVIDETDPRRLTIWAPETQQQELAKVLQELVPSEGVPGDSIMKAYAVTPEQKTRFTTILPTLAERLPDVTVIPETDTRRLTIWAPATQQTEVSELLQSLHVEDTADTRQVLAVYPLRQVDGTIVQQTLTKLFPAADIVLEPESEQIVVFATADQQEQIKAAIEKLDHDQDAGGKQQSIQVYPLKNMTATTARLAVLALVPDLTITLDTTNNSLIAWGRDRDHKELSVLLKQMEASAATGDREMKVYDTVDQDPVELSRIIEQLAPSALVSASRRSRGVAVWATAEEHSAIGPALEQLVALENQDKRELQTLSTVHTGAAAAALLLRGVAPEAVFFPSKDDRSLFSYAMAEEQPRIQSVMEQLEARNEAGTTDELKSYQYRKDILTAARPLVTARVPKAQWVETGTVDQWLISASQEDQAVIQQILDSLQSTMPDSNEQSLGIYVLDKVNPTDAQTTITTIVGPVTYLSSPVADQLRVWATATQHRQIDQLIKQLQQQVSEATETRPLEIYAIDSKTDVATVFESLNSELLAGMSVVQNPERNALIVRASPEKHAQLKTEIDAFLAALPEKVQRTPKVYPLKHVAPEAARLLLVTLVPTATYAVDPTQGNLAATAMAEEHEQIAAAIEQIDVPSDQPLLTKAYRVPTGYAVAIRTSLLPIYPQARISTDSTGSSLVVAATEQEHAEIAKIVDDVVMGSGRGAVSQVYTLKVASPLSVLSILRQVVPQSQASADAESGSVVVTATPEEHETIGKLLEDLDIAGKDRMARVYRLRNASPLAAQQALTQALPRASITVDRASSSLIATASPADHQQIQQTIDQLEASEDEDLETVSYTLTGADPRAAQDALESLIPSAQFAADPRAGVLIATASSAQQERIKSVVDQMENSDTNKPHARAIEIDGGNSERLYAMLSRMYRWDSEVRFTYESTSGTIMFVGPKRQEEAVMELVDQWNAVVKKEQPRDVKVYELMEVDGDAIVDSLDELFEEQAPKPDLQVQWYTNKLIAVATPEQHVTIQETIEQIRGQQRQLEVFTLQVNSPETVEDAIDQLFIDLPVGGSPSINSSVESQQIFVRATPSQLEEVRSLLRKLGEPAEVVGGVGEAGAPQGSTPGQGRVRVLSSDNADELLERLEKLWPQVSPVPLRVMRPQRPGDDSQPETSTEKSDAAPLIRTGLKLGEQEETRPDQQATDDDPPSRDQGLIVFPGSGKLTVASDDAQALSLFQELFEVLKQQEANAGKTEITGNFTVFQLENAGATEVAASVSRLYQQISASQSRSRSSSSPRSRVSVVPDERLNALIVYGPPNDRRTIEQLIKVLDTRELPLAMNRLNQARIVPVENVEAEQIMDVLESVYRTQLRPDQPPRIQIPAGVSVEVAVALRESNAAAAAPLLTLEVDQRTNSIIVLASERLGTEVESLIKRLDQENKDGNTRSFKVIALENSNTERIERALERMLRDRRRRP